MNALIEARDLAVRDGRRVIFEQVTLSIRAGEAVTIVGPNGGGKTTLLRTLVGARAASDGAARRAPGLVVGYMPQRLAVDRTLPMTVRRFLTLGRRGAAKAAGAALERVGAAHLADAQLSELSGGETQRALLARAVLRRPTLLALDEPTQGLDHRGAASFYALIAELRRELGAAALLVSHDLHVVMAASDRVICLNGHICCQGAPADVSAHPEYARLFGVETGGALGVYAHRHDHDHHQGRGDEHGRAAEGAP